MLFLVFSPAAHSIELQIEFPGQILDDQSQFIGLADQAVQTLEHRGHLLLLGLGFGF